MQRKKNIFSDSLFLLPLLDPRYLRFTVQIPVFRGDFFPKKSKKYKCVRSWFCKIIATSTATKKYLSLKIIKKPSTLALTLSKKTLVLTLLWTWNDGWDNIMLDTEWMNKNQKKSSCMEYKSTFLWNVNWPGEPIPPKKKQKGGPMWSVYVSKRIDFYGTNAVLKEKLT